jgi:uncharacterized iron-regulated membrane protein
MAGRPVRKALRLWHLAFGLGAGLWLLLLAATGCAIIFYDDLDRWLNPDWHSTGEPVAGAPQLDAALLKAQVRMPLFRPRLIRLPQAPDATIMMVGSMDVAGTAVPAQLLADPRTGALMGWRTTERLAFDRRHLMDTLYALHMDLMLGPWMAWFLGLVALLWVVDHIPAAILAIPNRAKWRSAFRVGGHRFNLRRLFDLHRAPGLWLFPITLMLAVTGLCLSWQDDMRAAVQWLSPVSERLHYDFPNRTSPASPVGLARALAAARAGGAGQAISIQLIHAKSVYAVRSLHLDDLDRHGRMWTYIDMTDGHVVARRHDNGTSAGDAFFAWLYPLHSGQAFGTVGRLVILGAGLATAGLCMSGLLLAVRRRRIVA